VRLEDASRLSILELASVSLKMDALSGETVPLGTDNSTHLKIEMMVCKGNGKVVIFDLTVTTESYPKSKIR
jgi:hypothetical protein